MSAAAFSAAALSSVAGPGVVCACLSPPPHAASGVASIAPDTTIVRQIRPLVTLCFPMTRRCHREAQVAIESAQDEAAADAATTIVVGAALLAGAGVVGAGLALQPGVPSIAPATTTVRQIVWVLSRMVSVLSGGLGRCNRHRQARPRRCGSGCLGHQAAHAMYELRDDRLRHLGPLGEQPLEAFAGDPQRARAFEAAHARRAR